MFRSHDEDWMAHSLKLAEHASEVGEVPVGAVLVYREELLGSGFNQSIKQHDPTAHAEVIALRDAALKLKNYRLLETTLYVTLEPCLMCVGALLHARIARLVFGAYDPKAGAVSSVIQSLDVSAWNHRILYTGGLRANACGRLLSEFFRKRR